MPSSLQAVGDGQTVITTFTISSLVALLPRNDRGFQLCRPVPSTMILVKNRIVAVAIVSCGCD